jgi:hypothetical protein
MGIAYSSLGSRRGCNRFDAERQALEVPPATFGDEALRRFIDEWLVPTMVDRYVREKLAAVKDEHNGNQPL